MIGTSITVVIALITLVIVFRISQEMREGMFNRFFMILKVAFLVPVCGRTIVALDFAYGILQGSVPNGPVLDALNLVTSILLCLAFVILYLDWRGEPVSGYP